MATFDILGAYIHTETHEDFIVVLKGPLAKLEVKSDPELYRKCVTINSKGKSILYVKMYKFLYILLISELLFYKS